MYQRPYMTVNIVNITLSGEIVKASPLRLGTTQGCPLASLLVNTIPEVLASAIRQEKEIQASKLQRRSKMISVYR